MYLIFRLKFLLAFSEDFYTKKSGLNPIKYSKNQQKILPAVPQVQYNKRKEECMDNTPYDDSNDLELTEEDIKIMSMSSMIEKRNRRLLLEGK